MPYTITKFSKKIFPSRYLCVEVKEQFLQISSYQSYEDDLEISKTSRNFGDRPLIPDLHLLTVTSKQVHEAIMDVLVLVVCSRSIIGDFISGGWV